MTIEEKFFKTFGIEKKNFYYCSWIEGNCSFDEFECSGCCHHEIYRTDYPEITAEKLLQLICIVDNFTVQSYLKKEPFNLETLKIDVLERCLFLYDCGISKDELIQKIRKLFEE